MKSLASVTPRTKEETGARDQLQGRMKSPDQFRLIVVPLPANINIRGISPPLRDVDSPGRSHQDNLKQEKRKGILGDASIASIFLFFSYFSMSVG